MPVKFIVETGQFVAEENYPRKSPWGYRWLDPSTHVPNCPPELAGFGWAPVKHIVPTLKAWESPVYGDVSGGTFEDGFWKVTATKKNIAKNVIMGQRLLDVAGKKASVFEVGFTYNGVVYDLDQANMTSVYAMLVSGVEGAHGGYWRARDNTKTDMTDDEVTTFLASAFAHGATAIRNGHVHKDALKALLDNGVKTAKQMYEYDISTGWPGE